MQENKVTVITICFNAALVIEKTMLSVLNQTYESLEYIIIDGSSSDSTLEIVKEVLGRYPHRATVCISEPDEGIWDAINKGVRMASGDWLNIMNAGDYYINENVLKDVFADPKILEAGMIYSDFVLRYPDHTVNCKASIEKCSLLHQAIIYRKSLHYDYGFYAVTKHLTCSDTLFFCLVPDKYYYKTRTAIASYDMTGVSNQSNDYGLRMKAVYFIFNKISFNELLSFYVKEYLKGTFPKWIWSILHAFNILNRCLRKKN